MKKTMLNLAVLLCATVAIARKPNYDESKIAPYTLEDPLEFADGNKVKTQEDWSRRRQEILEIFQKEMYGRMPPPPETLKLETIESGETQAGFAIRKQVRMYFREDKTGPKIDWLLLLPKYAKQPVPAIVFLNYGGNQELLPDKEILLNTSWLRNDAPRNIAEHHAVEESRGHLANPNAHSPFPAGMLIARGYAVMSACYGDISPDPANVNDQKKFAYTGVFSLWPPRDETKRDETTALAAWAWGLSRGLDLLEKEAAVDAKKVVVTGCSRLGKAAFIAGAFDERFAVVVPNQCGGGGITLAKRDFGENVSTEMKMFTHWYCKAYGKYVDNEGAMPFDQHLLVSCIAPRPLLVLGFDNKWFDTKGEWLAVRAASPVWTFLGKEGLPDVPFPDDMSTACIGKDLGYVRRPGEHGINYYDWTWMLDFADRALRK